MIVDQHGHDTLNVIAKADKFNRWMYDSIKPFLSGIILEIGSGIGNMSEYIFESASKLYLSDYNDTYTRLLEEKFSGEKKPEHIITMDLTDPDFDQKFESLFNFFDTIIALNVVEHISDDKLAVDNCTKLLKRGGHLVILVPAYPFLYNRFDKELGHQRRYTRKSLVGLLGRHLEIVHSKYFNFAGIFGWLFSGMVMRKKRIPSTQMRFFDVLVPVFRIAEKFVGGNAGLSVICTARKV